MTELNKEKVMIDKNKILVSLKDVTKKYKNKVALKNINLEINYGDRIGVIGANGGGKSTLSEIIGNIRKPTSGEVYRQENMVIGLQFQDSKYPVGITVFDMIKYYLETFNIAMTESELTKIMRTYQIESFKDKFLANLSGGQQQRVNILLSLIHNPDLVILDEISTGLDIEVRSEIFDYIKENVVNKGKSLLLVTHMMSEIEELCDKYIYIHNGEIRDFGMVSDIVKKHGSVHNYTWNKFKEEKVADLKKEAKINDEKRIINNKNKFDKIINKANNKGKNLPLIVLLLKYYIKGFVQPFFLLGFPIIMLFIEGFAFKGKMFGDGSSSTEYSLLHNLVGSIAITQIIATGIFVIPQTILEFKNSVLLKRIGATNIKPIFFVLTVVTMGVLFMLLTFFWTLLWAGIMFGTTYGWNEIAAPYQVWEALPFLMLILFSSVSLGLMLSSLFKSTAAYVAVANILYLPIAFLGGTFLPIDFIMTSDVLKYATYLNGFKYCMEPFNNAWSGKFEFDYVMGIFLGVSILITVVYIIIASIKLKWES
ncbi:ABC transporter ATP-binding protein [Spiroplasma helicoides]|uniref:ABC transporter ATP-binding protein n=1 Tax=Spiroplasma helicoides TaxID=216938 RepID=A0A1B3SLI6_9MOLU|nr:ATP-binding cassette domain-containing protein [Spiroplasma helicoides]AOG60783.1 ABC transporter ATP-binding protein [Spiroplasma helicoides]